MFELRFHPAVKKDLKKIKKSVVKEIKERHFTKLRDDPFAAENLWHIFKGLKSYHFKSENTEYRIIYEIYEDINVVAVLLIGKREQLYEKLNRRIG